jgi:hypothetical protein
MRVHLRHHPQRDALPGSGTLRSVVGETSWLLAFVDGDPLHKLDRERIIASIDDDAAQHQGRISVNRVRRALAGQVVLPQLIGATFSSLARSGVIKVAGWEVSDDTASHHRGTVIRTWRLAERWLP